MLSLFFITLIFNVFLHALGQPSLDDEFSPSQSQQIIMQTSQYHFIPTGSSLQFSLAGWQEGAESKFIDKVTVTYGLQMFAASNGTVSPYNFLVLYTDNSSDSAPYSQFNCYVRAVNEGLPQLMSTCNFQNNSITTGSCGRMIESAAANLFASTSTFFNCSDVNITYNITSASGVGPLNGTLLFIIDNSGLFPPIASSSEIKLIMSTLVVANVNEEERAKFYLFVGLTGILIVIMIVIAVALNCKIRKLDQELAFSSAERSKTQ